MDFSPCAHDFLVIQKRGQKKKEQKHAVLHPLIMSWEATLTSEKRASLEFGLFWVCSSSCW